MENMSVAVVQQRMSIPPTHEEFEAMARRFLRQARAKGVHLTIFPELSGVMLAPPLISGFKRGFLRRDDLGKQPTAGVISRSLGRLAGTTGGALGGGFRGSLERLLRKKSQELLETYLDMFSRLAREFGTAIVAGSLYLRDEETDTVKNRSYLFDVAGEVVGYQDKLNLAFDERDLATPGTTLTVLETRDVRMGLVLGIDALYPEVARLLAMQGADLLVGINASPGAAQARALRAALSVRAEENQVLAACSFLLGPNHLGRENREDLFGQSALLAPISLTDKGDGVLIQAGTDRTEAIFAGVLPIEQLHALREESRFQPRREMQLGDLRTTLAGFYQEGLTIEDAVHREPSAVTETPVFTPVAVEPVYPEEEPEAVPEEEPAEAPQPEPQFPMPSVDEVLSQAEQESPEE